MKLILSLLGSLAFTGMTCAHAGTAEAPAHRLDECWGPSQQDIADCLARLADRYDAELRQKIEQAKMRLEHWDEEENYKDAARSGLEQSHIAFQRFRALECDFRVALAGGAAGAGPSQVLYRCLVQVTARRISELEDIMNKYPFKD